MATGDMKARLLLDSKDFEKNVKKSKKSVGDFEKAGKELGASMVREFKAIAGAVLAIEGASGVFKAFINSSQSMSDSFRANIEGMRTIVDNFVYTLTNADFSPFADGLANMFKRAKEAAANEDQFGNTMLAANYVMATSGADYRAAVSKARDKSRSIEDRRAALEEARSYMAVVVEAQEALQRDAMLAARSGIAAKVGLGVHFIDEAAIKKAIALDASMANRAQREAIAAAYKQFADENAAMRKQVEEQYTTTTITPYGAVTQKITGYDTEMAKVNERIQQRKRANAELLVIYNLLFRDTDEQLEGVYSKATAAVQAMNQISEMRTSTNEISASLDNEAAAAAKEFEKLAEAEREVREEYERIIAIAKGGGLDTQLVRIGAASPLPSKLSPIKPLDADKMGQEAVDNMLINDVTAKAKELDNMNTIVGELSGSFAALGTTVGGAAGNMLTFVGSTLDAVKAIIPLIAYIQAEMVMHNANASAATKEAAAKTLSAYADIPFAGIALGVAGVAAIVAAIQSLPKFAEGGIVTRATLGVFGEAGPEAVMPLNKLEDYIAPRELRVTGNIKASGKELVVVLDNYNRVRNG